MKQLFTFPSEELLMEDTVYVTIVQELHATTLTNDKDRIQFENLVSDARSKVSDSDYDKKKKLLEQLETVLNNIDSLIKYIGGLVIYITPDDVFYYHLGISVNDNVYLGTLPYILPVAANDQYTSDFHLLTLNRESIRLFEGHGDKIEELDLSTYEDAPVDLETALGTEKDGGNLNFGAHSGAGSGQLFHGHQETSQEKDIDRERYFRLVDKFIFTNFSNDTKYPLIIYSVEDNQAVFKDLSDNTFLSDVTITGSATNVSLSDIQSRVAETLASVNERERNELLNNLKETVPENRIENIPDDLASASLQGRIETLFLQKGFVIPGSITEDGLYDREDENNLFIHQLVQNVIRAKGKLYIFEEDYMPEDTPIAAVLRY